MKMPSLEEATSFLAEAEISNPGPWIQHSKQVAEAAKIIAKLHPDLCPNTAFIFGYLHDIGRRVGVTDMRHVIDGYRFLANKGYTDAAQICLSHSFPVSGINYIAGKWDCSDEELSFVEIFLGKTEFSEYDKLIQLCDAIALPSGFCIIEKRLFDVALRRGVNEYTVLRWKAYLNLQKKFEGAIGCSIYQILPGVVENSLLNYY